MRSAIEMRRFVCSWIAIAALPGITACGDGGGAGAADAGDTETEAVLGDPVLRITHRPIEPTEAAAAAIDLAPAWLRDDLAISFGGLGAELQDALAALITGAEDPRTIDEIAFAVAHTSPEVLSDPLFYPELLALNARLIYARDADLDYVQLVDVGEPGIDDDYHTTATYRFEASPGVADEETIDRELYYWYVVHPRLEDEWPLFIDAWASGNGVAPAEGWFWRGFLWDEAGGECPEGRVCPLLADFLQGVPVVKGLGEESGFEANAGDQILAYTNTALTWGADAERPIQPCRIYGKGFGHCGEFTDLRVAAFRTGLVPARNVGAFVNDHVWPEWWSESWQGELSNYSTGTVRDRGDNDCDGIADDALDDEDLDGDGVTLSGGDCNDADPEVFPGAEEIQNGYDDDCDGQADTGFADSELDGDGDGFLFADGDCDDLDPARHPGAEEAVNGYDDDCDGVADDGANADDADDDGYAIAGGDCDDTNAAINPAAAEAGNGHDDDCDGAADEGLDAHDRDGDGVTMAAGDCDDLDALYYPGALDPWHSAAPLFIISDTRGDAFIGNARTAAYGTLHSTLAFAVTDGAGTPVDGALINLFGTWAVYGMPDQWGWAGMAVTGLDGTVAATVGEFNPYGYQVRTPIGDAPEGNYLYQAVELSLPNETYDVAQEVPGAMPARAECAEADLTGGAPAQLLLDLQVEVASHRVAAPSPFTGAFSLEGAGGRVDVLLVDAANLAAFAAGEPFTAQLVRLDAAAASAQVELPGDRAWTLIVANQTALATTMVGTVAVAAHPAGGAAWPGEDPSLAAGFQIPPGEHLAIELSLPAAED